MGLCHNLIKAVRAHALVLEQAREDIDMALDINTNFPAATSSPTSPMSPPISPTYSTFSASSASSASTCSTNATRPAAKMSVGFMLNEAGQWRQQDRTTHQIDQGSIECASALASLCQGRNISQPNEPKEREYIWREHPRQLATMRESMPRIMTLNHRRLASAAAAAAEAHVQAPTRVQVQAQASRVECARLATDTKARAMDMAHKRLATATVTTDRVPVPASPEDIGTDSASSSPTRRPSRPSRPKGSAKQYSDEECDFTLYHYVDKSLPWEDVLLLFNKQFPPNAGEKRTRMGIQARYYRNNKHIPVMDQSGLAEFDANGRRREESCKVREQTQRKGRRVGLLDSFPERAMFYSWVDEEHRRHAEPRGRMVLRQIQSSVSRSQRKRTVRQRR